MPSSPTAVSSTRQAAIVPRQLNQVHDQYQTVYDDGRGRYIFECRRRSKMGHGTDAKTLGSSRRPRIPASIATASPKCLSPVGSLSYPSSKASSKFDGLAASRESLSAQRSSSTTRPAVIIIATPRKSAKKTQESVTAPERWGEPTPPPTPRLGRLPTPELSDLDEAPFCGCDDEAAIVKYCKSCKKESVPRSNWF